MVNNKKTGTTTVHLKLSVSFLIAILLGSCLNDSSSKKIRNSNNQSKVLKRICVFETGQTRRMNTVNYHISEFHHYVIIENFSNFDDCAISIKDADNYRDTCTFKLPIGSVTFCKPFDFIPYGDSRDVEILNAHSLITIGYDFITLAKKFPDVAYIDFWNNGKLTEVKLSSQERSRERGDFDSAGNFKTDWMKDIDRKFHTNNYDLRYGMDSGINIYFPRKKDRGKHR
jgi:hypothetical protein